MIPALRRAAVAAVVPVTLLLLAAAIAHELDAARAESGLERACPARPQRIPARALRGPSNPDAVPLARTGRIFASHASGRRVSIIDVATGEIRSLAAGIGDPHEVGVSPDGRWGVAADFGDHTGDFNFDGRRLAVFDLHSGSPARVIDLGRYLGPHDVVFLAHDPSRALVTTQTTRNIIEVDVAAGDIVASIPTNAKGSHTMAVSADGSRAFTANQGDGTISILDVRGRSLLARHSLGVASVEGIAVTPDGSEIWVGSRDDSTVRVVDAGTGATLAMLRGVPNPERMHMSPDGRRALITDWGCDVIRVVDVASRRELGVIQGIEGAGTAKFLPDSRLALIAMSSEGAVVLADVDERRAIARWELGRRIDAAAWGPVPRVGSEE